MYKSRSSRQQICLRISRLAMGSYAGIALIVNVVFTSVQKLLTNPLAFHDLICFSRFMADDRVGWDSVQTTCQGPFLRVNLPWKESL